MKYLLTLWGDEARYGERTPEQIQASMKEWDAYTVEVQDAGAFLGGEGLQPTATATTIAIQADGNQIVTDGPFAETKEQLGGFYLLECDSLDEAIEWAAKIPGAQFGSVEVRPVMNYEGSGAEGAQQSAAAHS